MKETATKSIKRILETFFHGDNVETKDFVRVY